MTPNANDLLLTYLHGIALMALVTLIYGYIVRLGLSTRLESAAKGVVFGFGALAAMLSPVEVIDGVLIDGRATFVGFAGAFGGPIGVAVAAAMVAGLRISMGGVGVPLALVALLITSAGGLAWGRMVRGRVRNEQFSLLLLGTLLTLSVFSFLALPGSQGPQLMAHVGPFLLASSIFSSVVLGSFIEREERRLARERRLADDAGIDPLTGVMNRRAFEQALADMRADQPCALLVIDIDRFKTINDTHGHATGDLVLKATAETLRDAVRGSDVLARLGGEEFAVLLPGALAKDARRVAERIRASIAEQLRVVDGRIVNATVSVGAQWAAGWRDFESMYRPADAALYRAKDSGRNRVEFASPQMRAA